MKKDFKIANRPLTTTPPDTSDTEKGTPAAGGVPPVKQASKITDESAPPPENFTTAVSSRIAPVLATPRDQPTTRKTIEVPEEYFHKVKMRAVERRIKEKDLWAEILSEYFISHPAV